MEMIPGEANVQDFERQRPGQRRRETRAKKSIKVRLESLENSGHRSRALTLTELAIDLQQSRKSSMAAIQGSGNEVMKEHAKTAVHSHHCSCRNSITREDSGLVGQPILAAGRLSGGPQIGSSFTLCNRTRRGFTGPSSKWTDIASRTLARSSSHVSASVKMPGPSARTQEHTSELQSP